MPNMTESVMHLAQEIGPRPAGTEEEQQSALYIEDKFSKQIGLPTVTEEFEGATGNNLTRLICSGVSLVGALLFMISSALAIPGLILTLLAAVVLVCDYFDKPLIARFLSRGVSQNVVAKYKPDAAPAEIRGRRRKLIIVTRYDSGKVQPELSGPLVPYLGVANRVSAASVCFLFVWLVIRSLFAMYPDGVAAIILNVITVLAMICAALPLILKVMAQSSAYNDGANSSASGVAVMLDVAQRVVESSLMVPEFSREEPVVHGFDEAVAEGLIPEGAQIAYEFEDDEDFRQGLSEQETNSFEPVVVASAAFTEESPMSADATLDTDVTTEAAVDAAPAVHFEPVVAAAAVVETVAEPVPVAVPTPEPANTSYDHFDNVPDWFRAAQEKAKKTETPVTVHRSKYADALDAALAQAPAAAPAETQPAPMAQPAPVPQAAAAPIVVEPAAEPLPVENAVAVNRAKDILPEMPVDPAFAGEGVLPTVPTEEVGESQISPEVAPPAFLSGELPHADAGERVVVSAGADEDPAQSALDEAVTNQARAARPAVVLPDVGESNLKPIDELKQQRAPLADGATSGVKTTAKGLLNMLPSISLSMNRIVADNNGEGKKRPSIILPSFSGVMEPVETEEKKSGSAGMTGTFAPVGETLVETAVQGEEDLYIDDADDSDFEENFTESGAYAGPDYVEMPKSRFGGVFGRIFGGKNKQQNARPEVGTNEWLDVDDDFDARSVGEARGDWSSFQEDSQWEQGATIAFDPTDVSQDSGQKRNWEGGAFSGMKEKMSGAAGAFGKAKDRFTPGKADQQQALPQDEPSTYEADEPSVRPRREYHSEFADLGFTLVPDTFEEDQKTIEQFQNPTIQTEVWFVALGSDLDGNAGMKAFMDAHADELRGSIILELDSVGAGNLSVVKTEGSLKKVSTSSRMKRLMRKANQALGVSLGSVEMTWNDSASSYANSHGCQAMHMVGMENGKPALFAQADDVAENVEEPVMQLASDYVMEIIKAM